jgi:hypothetical protein
MTGLGNDRRRVALSLFDTCDPSSVIAWLAEAWAAIDGKKPISSSPTTIVGLIEAVKARWHDAQIECIDVSTGELTGFIMWEDGPSEIVIRGLSIRRDRRDLGYGTEAVEWLAASRPDLDVAAAIPRHNGLAVYFWLRVGFRPVREDEDRARSHDPEHLWMFRAAAGGISGGMSDP